MNKEVILIGYSGHAYVVAEIMIASQYEPRYYCEQSEKVFNPYKLQYLGNEKQALLHLQNHFSFIAIGDNRIRKKIMDSLIMHQILWMNAIHPSAIVSNSSRLQEAIMIGAGVIVNAQSTIGKGTICNTGSIIEHECVIGDFVHIAPGAVLCGNVAVGDNTFIGANAVVRQGLRIGKNAVIGAGSVVLTDVPDDVLTIGNPSRIVSQQ